jgi:hypothetical protein
MDLDVFRLVRTVGFSGSWILLWFFMDTGSVSVFHSYNFLLFAESVIQRNIMDALEKIELHLEKM